MRRTLERADQDDTGSCVKLETGDGSVAAGLAAHSQWYRAEADEWECLASQISLIPDRQYFLSCARELRAKAAALESAAGASPPSRP